jgi:hypothetical protein
MTPAKSGDPDVEAGDVFVECSKQKGVRASGSCEQRGSPILQGRKWLQDEECGSGAHKDGAVAYTE